MTLSLRWFARSGLLLVAVSIVLLAAGCGSDNLEGRKEGPSRHARPFPPLVGQAAFFDGQIIAELNVGNGAGFAGRPGKEDDGAGSEHKHHGGGSYGGGHHRDNGDSGGDDDSVSAQIDRDQMALLRSAAANGNPPVMIHLRFTNKGTTHADLLVPDFLSPLGNFVIEPEKLALEPGQTVEVEPMTSRLAGEIPETTVMLALRLAGRGEKKTIPLKLAPAVPAAPSPQDPAKAADGPAKAG